jgi:hypothetical protein
MRERRISSSHGLIAATDELALSMLSTAEEAGDVDQVVMCRNALAGDRRARADCIEAFKAACTMHPLR